MNKSKKLFLTLFAVTVLIAALGTGPLWSALGNCNNWLCMAEANKWCTKMCKMLNGCAQVYEIWVGCSGSVCSGTYDFHCGDGTIIYDFEVFCPIAGSCPI